MTSRLAEFRSALFAAALMVQFCSGSSTAGEPAPWCESRLCVRVIHEAFHLRGKTWSITLSGNSLLLQRPGRPPVKRTLSHEAAADVKRFVESQPLSAFAGAYGTLASTAHPTCEVEVLVDGELVVGRVAPGLSEEERKAAAPVLKLMDIMKGRVETELWDGCTGRTK